MKLSYRWAYIGGKRSLVIDGIYGEEKLSYRFGLYTGGREA